tara:strand:+ start:171 stop:542 length:372 start_codon:yes stop_codon:yes gene_type:complete
MLDKILSVKASAGTMTFFMAFHIVIMAVGGGSEYWFEAMLFVPLTLVSLSIFYMSDENARRALLALGVGWIPTTFMFTYGWVSGWDRDDLPPIPGMVMWWLFSLQAILVGLKVGVTSEASADE